MKLDTYNDIVEYHNDPKDNTDNFIHGLQLYYDKFNKIYEVLEVLGKELGEHLVVLPSFNSLDTSNSLQSRFEEVRFKVRGNNDIDTEKVITDVINEKYESSFEYVMEGDIHILRFK